MLVNGPQDINILRTYTMKHQSNDITQFIVNSIALLSIYKHPFNTMESDVISTANFHAILGDMMSVNGEVIRTVVPE